MIRFAARGLAGLLIFLVVAAVVAAHAAQAAIDTAIAAAARAAADGLCPDPVCGGPGPVTGQWTRPINGHLGSGFRTAARPGHDGIDLLAPRGTNVWAAAAGTVIAVVCNASNGNCDIDGSKYVDGCGWYVELLHRDSRAGSVVTRYCHLLRRPPLRIGQRVAVGQVIGAEGSSGNSSGPHLHFEVHLGRRAYESNAVDPVPFLAARGVHLPRSGP